MKCPNCKKLMTEKKVKDFLFDYCKECGSMFFEEGGLLVAKEEIDYNEIFDDIPVKQNDKNITFLCPKCKKDMQKIVYEYDSGIFIDLCYKCNGIFLENGKLIQISTYLKDMEKGRELRLKEAEKILSRFEKQNHYKRKIELDSMNNLKKVVYKLFRI